MRKFILSRVRPALYDGDEGAAAAKAAADAAAASAAAAASGNAGKTFTQDELNKHVTERVKKERTEKEALVKQLESIKTSGMTAEDKAALETQIETLNKSLLTNDELARRTKEKADKEWSNKYTEKETEANQWRSRHDNLLIDQAINGGMLKHDVLAAATPFVKAALRETVKLVDVKNDEGEVVGQQAMVRVQSNDKTGKPITLELSVEDGIKFMKDNPEQYGFAFKGTANAGLGGGSGKPGDKKVDYSKLTAAEWREHKAKNPGATASI